MFITKMARTLFVTQLHKDWKIYPVLRNAYHENKHAGGSQSDMCSYN